jgi:lipopolysaccharide export system permease protein
MSWLRRHDRHLLRAWAGTFGAVLVFFTVIVLVLDAADRLGRLGRGWAAVRAEGRDPLLLVAEFYATLVPFMWLKILPFVTPMAAALCLSRIIRHNELVPLLMSGVSKRRLALPLLLSGVAVGGFSFLVQESLVPRLARRHAELGRLLSKSQPDRIQNVPHLHDPGGARLSMAAFLPLRPAMESVQLTFRDPGGETTAIRAYPEVTWDARAGAWVAPRGGVLVPLDRDRTGMTRIPIPPGDAVPVEASPVLLEISASDKPPLGLSLAETRELARAHPDSPRITLMQHALFTQPVSALVMLLLTLPFAFSVGRRDAWPLRGIVISGGVGAAFFAASYFCASLAAAGDLNPVVLAWLPTVVFGALGATLYLGMDD